MTLDSVPLFKVIKTAIEVNQQLYYSVTFSILAGSGVIFTGTHVRLDDQGGHLLR
jgi:hypothetical protein